MNKNEKGFGLFEILITIVVIGLIGAVGWLVYERQSDDKPAQKQETAQEDEAQKQEPKKSTIPEGWVEYKNEEIGFSFAYPQEWSLKENSDSFFHAANAKSVELKSQDYETEEVAMGGEEISSGQIISLYYQSTQQLEVDNSVKYKQGPCSQAGVVEYQEVTVSGVDALQFECNWEHDGPLEVGLVSNGYRYFLTFNSAGTDALDDETASSSYPTFEKFIDSFSLSR